ncbi:hypothetical protein [Paenibacillus dendritiformis]|uniref:hypothetical protein n=1 Tax=Paenibacillus dendritiformis TaxID=130049 RepID=UPI00387E0DFE
MDRHLPPGPVHPFELLARALYAFVQLAYFTFYLRKGGFGTIVDGHGYIYAIGFFRHPQSPSSQRCSSLPFLYLGFQRQLGADKTKKPLSFGQLHHLAREFPLALENMMQEGGNPSRFY